MVIPNVNIWIWDIPCLSFCDLRLWFQQFSRQIFVLGISQHKSRYPWDILSYFGNTMVIPWNQHGYPFLSARIHSLPHWHWAAAAFGALRLLLVPVALPRIAPSQSCITAICSTSASVTDRPPQTRLAHPKAPQPLVHLVYSHLQYLSLSHWQNPQTRLADPKAPQPLVHLVYVASLPAQLLGDIGTAYVNLGICCAACYRNRAIWSA